MQNCWADFVQARKKDKISGMVKAANLDVFIGAHCRCAAHINYNEFALRARGLPKTLKQVTTLT